MAGPSGGGGTSTPAPTILNNYAATVAPTATDDASAGYAVGSSWLISGTGEMWRCRSATAGAARWVKIDVADHPGYVAGRYFAPFGQGAPVGGGTHAVGTMYLSFGVIKERITISQLQARVTTAVAGGNFQLAVYNHDPASAKVSTLVASSVSASTANAGPINGAVSGGNTPIEPGNYWFASQSDSAVAFLSTGPTSTNHLSLVGSTTGIGTSATTQPCSIAIGGQTFGTWPADLSGLTQNEQTTARAPLVAFLVASVP